MVYGRQTRTLGAPGEKPGKKLGASIDRSPTRRLQGNNGEQQERTRPRRRSESRNVNIESGAEARSGSEEGATKVRGWDAYESHDRLDGGHIRKLRG